MEGETAFVFILYGYLIPFLAYFVGATTAREITKYRIKAGIVKKQSLPPAHLYLLLSIPLALVSVFAFEVVISDYIKGENGGIWGNLSLYISIILVIIQQGVVAQESITKKILGKG